MVLFVFFMQLALNVPVWVIISEMFPLRLRGMGMGMCVLCLWVANAIVAFLFPIVVEAVGIVGAFLVFVVLGLIAIAFLKAFLPETKGRSLEELEERSRPASSSDLRQSHTLRHSANNMSRPAHPVGCAGQVVRSHSLNRAAVGGPSPGSGRPEG